MGVFFVGVLWKGKDWTIDCTASKYNFCKQNIKNAHTFFSALLNYAYTIKVHTHYGKNQKFHTSQRYQLSSKHKISIIRHFHAITYIALRQLDLSPNHCTHSLGTFQQLFPDRTLVNLTLGVPKLDHHFELGHVQTKDGSHITRKKTHVTLPEP